jgi:hypothetical protein
MIIVKTKICTRCNQKKSLDKFHNDKIRSDGKVSGCKECMNECVRNYYARSTGRTRDQIRRNGTTKFSGKIINGKKVCTYCKKWKTIDCFTSNNITIANLQSACKVCRLMCNRVRDRILKIEFILAYSENGGCLCCGETAIDLLTVDHIRDKGYKLLEGYNVTHLIYKLKELKWPIGYRVMCYNCNCSTKHGRACVHTEEHKTYLKELEEFIIINNQQKQHYDKLKQKLQELNEN